MEVSPESSFAKEVQARREKVAELRESLVSLKSSVKDLQDQAAGTGSETRNLAVQLEFDDDGVLNQVRIDDRIRSTLTEEELLQQFAFAFISAPLPRAVIARLLDNPAGMVVLRESGALSSVEEFTEERGVLTLIVRYGKPVQLRAAAGKLLG